MSLGKLYSTHARLDCTDYRHLASATYIVKSSMNMTIHEANTAIREEPLATGNRLPRRYQRGHRQAYLSPA